MDAYLSSMYRASLVSAAVLVERPTMQQYNAPGSWHPHIYRAPARITPFSIEDILRTDRHTDGRQGTSPGHTQAPDWAGHLDGRLSPGRGNESPGEQHTNYGPHDLSVTKVKDEVDVVSLDGIDVTTVGKLVIYVIQTLSPFWKMALMNPF